VRFIALFIIFTITWLPPVTKGFGVLDQISQDTSISDLITENILAISPSKRIFVLSNENRSFSKGDFISLVFNATLTARAIVAKNSDSGSGVKIVKIYNWQKWQQLTKGIPVQIIRGDDSYFKSNQKSKEQSKEDAMVAQIESEEDLFNQTEIIGDELSQDEKQSKIRQDNLLSVNYGIYSVTGTSENLSLNMFSLSYNYQIGSDFWIGINAGSGTLQAFPASNLNTNITTITLSGSYLFKLPFYSYILPYAGFNYQMASSPKAGTNDGTNTQDERDLEIAEVEALNVGNIIFGAKIVRHLAPGWYGVVSIGTDMMRAGVAIEF
jgi:hypothetical protein